MRSRSCHCFYVYYNFRLYRLLFAALLPLPYNLLVINLYLVYSYTTVQSSFFGSLSVSRSLYSSLSLLSTLYVIVIKLTSLAVVSAVVVYLPMLAIHIVFFIFFSFIFAHHVHLHASIFASSHYCPTMFYYYVWPCSSHYLMSKLSISIKLLSFTINTLTYTHLNIEQILH